MKPNDVVSKLLEGQPIKQGQGSVHVFAPTNIALCKYWGKRNLDINLPLSSSFSVTLPNLGTQITLERSVHKENRLFIKNKEIPADHPYTKRMNKFLSYFNLPVPLSFKTVSSIPIGAGLASSSSFFAGLTKALNDFFCLNLDEASLSIIARLGSGSACRSFWNGFVEWNAGIREDGMDSYATPFMGSFPSLRLGVLLLSSKEKPIPSREAMNLISTSPFASLWNQKCFEDTKNIKTYIKNLDFPNFGMVCENNALSMHALMLSSWPSVNYYIPSTIKTIHKIYEARKNGLNIFFTQDAGPNIKLIFEEKDSDEVREIFPQCKIIIPFPHP